MAKPEPHQPEECVNDHPPAANRPIFTLSGHLEASARTLLDRHLERSREWFPHQLVPWRLGEDETAQVEPDAVRRPECPGVRSALLVNLLTEDNLPHYFYQVAGAFSDDSAMSEWARRWAAEEQRHSIVVRDWICVTRQLDLEALERARMHQVSTGFKPGLRAQSACDGLVYLAFQELATRVSYRNTAQQLLDRAGAAIMNRVAADENLHFLFYRDMATAAMEEDPSAGMQALDRQVTNFEMPGTGILGFTTHAAAIAAAGIYDYSVHYEQILDPLVRRHWKVESVCGLDAAGEVAREHLLGWMARVERVAERLKRQRVATPAV
jgi:acyl-[acyl-carrier-protein] desaturase